VLDARTPQEFDAGHVLGALNLPVTSPGVGTRAGWSVTSEEPILIAAADRDSAHAMASALQAVGLSRLFGYVAGDGTAWGRAGLPVATAGAWDVAHLALGLREDTVDLVDVRDSAEWAAGHVAGSHHLPLHRLGLRRASDLPDHGRTTAVACASGMRAAFAASVLRRAGRRDVVRVAGGGIADLPEEGIELAVGA
jgi:hydroxyacylglutathione hydrolase